MQLVEAARSFLRSFLAAIGRGPVSALVLTLFRRPAQTQEGLSVHMLVSSKTCHAGLLAAASFEHQTGRRWNFFIHDDGSVTKAQRRKIENVLPGVRFVPRSEADKKVSLRLADHPRCIQNRQSHNLFLKFFDTLAFVEEERFVVLDSDVLFFKRPTEILEWVDSRSEACHYNEDTREKYCIPREEIEKALSVCLLPRFNSGLVLMQRKAMNADLAERLLTAFEGKAHAPQFFEQTLYALMATTNSGGGRALPKTYNISWGYLRAPGSICRHYVGKFKHDLLYIEGAPLLLWEFLKARAGGCTRSGGLTVCLAP